MMSRAPARQPSQNETPENGIPLLFLYPVLFCGYARIVEATKGSLLGRQLVHSHNDTLPDCFPCFSGYPCYATDRLTMMALTSIPFFQTQASCRFREARNGLPAFKNIRGTENRDRTSRNGVGMMTLSPSYGK